MDQIIIKNIFKIFGPEPQKAISLIEQGLTKEEVLEKTGMTVGVNNADFSIKRGEIFVIMGLSGSGKSTLVRMFNRLIEPSAGEIHINGKNITAMENKDLVKFRLKHMSMVFQSFALMPHLTVLDNAAFGLELAGEPKAVRNERAAAALSQVGLEGWEDQYPKQLSGGMQQRVGLARALAAEPDIMLMDEAFSALDPLIRTEMQDELLKLQENSDRTIVFISHDLDEALRIGHRIAIMEGGRVVQVGTPEEILQNPADDYVRAFFRGVDPTNVISAKEIVNIHYPTIIKTRKGDIRSSLELLNARDFNHGYVLNAKRQFLGIVSIDSLQQAVEAGRSGEPLDICYLPEVNPAHANDNMQDILPEVASKAFPIPVINDDNVFMGVVSKNRFLKTLHKSDLNGHNGSGNEYEEQAQTIQAAR
ncbi:glycine betaine/L-proline ABC transporter ATP-binding protein ProV [uncultured Desulfobacter sp.]|uniref:glycine betaine/L-proline ABC transporter ATP-binding protein ProV n=1 Tax=uncultured Desulfobacter sp. TaxID=240139 RepID=UPI002AABDF2D|nr:glycine betaine/L-proline ABC transporter ATP-binding protein ProV [uncultured Desulfobacter sp.]